MDKILTLMMQVEHIRTLPADYLNLSFIHCAEADLKAAG